MRLGGSGRAGAVARAVSGRSQTSGVTASLRGVSAVNERVAWASGSGTRCCGRPTAARRGRSSPVRRPTAWTSATSTPSTSARAYVLSIGDGPPSRIYKTTDAGATWTLQFANQDPKVFLRRDGVLGRDHGIAVSDSVDGRFVIIMTGRRQDVESRAGRSAAAGASPTRASSPPAARTSPCSARTTSGSARARRRRRACCAHRIADGRWTIAETPLLVRRRRRASTRSRFATTGTAWSSAATTTRKPKRSTTAR